MSKQPLELRFDPHTVEHLGSQMYSRLPNAVAELVANAYDADAEHATVQIIGSTAGDQIIQVHDDGHGMDRNDLQEKYLRIGRNRRTDSSGSAGVSEGGRRQVSGKKGIGKLALFGIGNKVKVQTTRRGESRQYEVELDYQEMLASGTRVYRPRLTEVDVETSLHGTTIRLSDLRRTSPINAENLANSLARLFNYSEAGNDRFLVTVVSPSKNSFLVDRSRRIESIDTEYSWNVPDDLPEVHAEAAREYGIAGTIVSSRPTLPENQRGVTIFVRGRLANEPEFYGASSTSFAFSYLTGFLDIDRIDDLGPDLIASDRRSINWEADETVRIREAVAEMITWIGQDRRRRQRQKKQQRVKKSRGIDIEGWSGTIRSQEAEPLDRLLGGVIEDDSISDSRLESIVEDLEEIVPQYAPLYWRHLHEDVQAEVENFYTHADYFKALDQALMLYVDLVRDRSGSVAPELNMMQQVFKEEAPIIDVSSRFESLLPQDSSRNLNRSQKTLSEGILAGFRNLIAHHREKVLLEKGIFSDSDCLDALGMISYLYSRVKALDDSTQSSEGKTEDDGDSAVDG
jgi:uncharacterized protein (TIGR02391 family)